jgi:hypothetical protein
MGTLTSAELAFELGATIDRVADLVSIRGLKPRDGLFETADIHRAKAILTFLDAGIRLDHLDQLIDEGSITFDFVDQFFLARAPRFKSECRLHSPRVRWPASGCLGAG